MNSRIYSVAYLENPIFRFKQVDDIAGQPWKSSGNLNNRRVAHTISFGDRIEDKSIKNMSLYLFIEQIYKYSISCLLLIFVLELKGLNLFEMLGLFM